MSTSPRLNIAFVLQNRHELFYLINPLIRRGHTVTLFMNYPKNVIRRFGIVPECRLVTCVPHGIFLRIVYRLNLSFLKELVDISFGHWAAGKVIGGGYDAIMVTNGVALELLAGSKKGPKNPGIVLNQMISHPERTYHVSKLLAERFGVSKTMESWSVIREKKECELASHIRVISDYAKASFVAHGVPASKLFYNPSGDPVESFRVTGPDSKTRAESLVKGDKVHVLFTGSFSARKGAFDIRTIIERTDPERFEFTIVGAIHDDLKDCERALRERGNVRFTGRIPQPDLAKYYRQAHVYLFPTYDEGYAQTLAQARAGGLLLLTTPNCQSREYFGIGAQGWVLEAGDTAAMAERLCWVDANREAAAQMLSQASQDVRIRTFDDAAGELETYLTSISDNRKSAM